MHPENQPPNASPTVDESDQLSSSDRGLPFVPAAPLGSSAWLLHLRWFAVAGQLLTILIARQSGIARLPWTTLWGLVGVTAVTNVGYTIWLSQRHRPPGSTRREKTSHTGDSAPHDSIGEVPLGETSLGETSLGETSLGETSLGETSLGEDRLEEASLDEAHGGLALALMLLDLIVLTGMLHVSGGADNPFCLFYFVNLAVGGVMIHPRFAWSLTLTAIGGYAFLIVMSPPLRIFGSAASIGSTLPATIIEITRMVAFATCASVVTYYVTRTAGESHGRHVRLLRLQRTRDQSRRLQGLTTLAAGAAHELATPLSTIDVVVRELSRHLESCDKPESVEHDLRLIDDELDRCRQILSRMRAAAGDSAAESFARTTVGDLIDATLDGVRDPHRVDVLDGSISSESTPMFVPSETVAQAIRNLIHNGLDAAGPRGRVRLETEVHPREVYFRVRDDGSGMSDEVMARISEPFYTTKEPGRGIGLGLFLTRNVISQLGGSLSFHSEIGVGTTATVQLPRSDVR